MPVETGQMRFLDHDILRSIQSIEIVARLLVEGMYASRHRCPFYGYSVEFKDYREYVPGDDPKTLDWKLLARTERYYVKRFEMESNMNIVCLLDASGSMGYKPKDHKRLTKMEYGSYLSASLAYLACKQQDSPGLVTFGDEIQEFIPPKQGQRHLFGLLARLDGTEAGGTTDIENVLKKIGVRMKHRSIIMVISDCLGDEEGTVDGLKYLAAQGHEVVMLHLMDSDEVKLPFNVLTSFEDLENGRQLMCDPVRQRKKYLARLAAFKERIRSGCLACGADYRFLDTEMPIEIALRDYLLYRRMRG